ncbi:MAG: GerMN domain-containing protein [Phascolarctobacterium sp.]|nr:GerMN domain-containing protein [Phascolarctobacterium sp.]
MKKILLLMLLVAAVIVGGCAGDNTKPDIKPQEAKQISYIVYRPAADGSQKLLPEKITMPDNGKSLPENALLTLITKKPVSDKMESLVPQGTKVLGLKVNKDGTAYADFSKEIVKRGEGSYNEFMLTGAIVNTLTEFPEIKRVQILVDGKKVTSIGGYMDLEEPLERNTTLLQK